MTTKKEREQEEARDRLREILKPGDTVYTVLRHVSRSGMSRAIDAYVIRDDEPMWLSRHVARAGVGTWSDKYEAVNMGGCGMDMGFALVYGLAHTLWPNGFDHIDKCRCGHTSVAHMREECALCLCEHWYCICPSNDHSNNPTGEYVHHSDGGYALKHRWM